jgi:hypothetical protein
MKCSRHELAGNPTKITAPWFAGRQRQQEIYLTN